MSSTLAVALVTGLSGFGGAVAGVSSSLLVARTQAQTALKSINAETDRIRLQHDEVDRQKRQQAFSVALNLYGRYVEIIGRETGANISKERRDITLEFLASLNAARLIGSAGVRVAAEAFADSILEDRPDQSAAEAAFVDAMRADLGNPISVRLASVQLTGR